jgi:hypothetical protein
MSRKRFSVAALAAMALAVIATSVAWADPTSTHSGGAFAAQIGNVKIDPSDPSVAYVTGRYNCPTGDAHLFVSVKQVAGGKPDSGLKAEGSSALTFPGGAWLFRHPGGNEFTCDGSWHTSTWWISSDLPEPGDDYAQPFGRHGSLVPGQVYVQFCWDSPDEGATWHAYSEQFAHASY